MLLDDRQAQPSQGVSFKYLLAVLLIVVIAAMPLLTRPGLPRHTDLELHVFRAAEFQGLLADRPLDYPRWAPDFYYGYGYPIFNYYAPLTYYAATAFASIPGVAIVDGMKGVLLLTFALAAYGAFFLGRRHFGSTGGLVASAAYTLSPYVVFIDPFMRGDAAEFLALGCLPWLFLAFDRPMANTRQIAFAALALAAFVFSHNLLAIVGVGWLAAWLLWRGLTFDGARRWLRDLAAIALAAAIAAVFWLPFVAERGAVRLDVAGPGHFDFRNHFIELGTLLRPSPVLDFGATTPHFIYNLGLLQWLLALPALLAWRRTARTALFFALAALLLIFLVTPASAFVWEGIPAAAIMQFPWRFLGPIALALAMCAAYTTSLVRRIRFASPIALAMVLGFALPTLYPPLWDADFGDASPRGSIEFELRGVALGTTSTGDFLPATVSQLPAPAQSLLDAYARGATHIDRFDAASAPGASVTSVRLDDLDAEYALGSAAADFTARFFVFVFPGWQAYVDGQPVPMKPAEADGLIRFDVPASARTFGVRFESTSPRTAGALLSLAGALITIVLLFLPAHRQTPTLTPTPNSNALLLTLVVFLLVKLAVFDRCDTCFRYTSPPGEALAASVQQRAGFDGYIELLGFDLQRPEVQPGEALPLTLYWKATAPVSINYQVFAHLTRPASILWGQSDKLNPGDFPSTRWPLDKYVWDDHRIRVLPGTPPGEYTLVVGLYTLGDGRRALVTDESSRPAGDSVQLSLPVRVTRVDRPPSIESLGVQTLLDRHVGDLKLIGSSIEQATLPRPNFVRLTLFWQASVDAPGNVNVRVRMIDPAGATANEVVTSPTGGFYPTSSWRSDEIVRDVYALWLPSDFPPVRYGLQVEVSDESGRGAQVLTLGTIEVTGP